MLALAFLTGVAVGAVVLVIGVVIGLGLAIQRAERRGALADPAEAAAQREWEGVHGDDRA